jgi:thymidylate kinase
MTSSFVSSLAGVVISIDGVYSSGKSSLAKSLAKCVPNAVVFKGCQFTRELFLMFDDARFHKCPFKLEEVHEEVIKHYKSVQTNILLYKQSNPSATIIIDGWKLTLKILQMYDKLDSLLINSNQLSLMDADFTILLQTQPNVLHTRIRYKNMKRLFKTNVPSLSENLDEYQLKLLDKIVSDIRASSTLHRLSRIALLHVRGETDCAELSGIVLKRIAKVYESSVTAKPLLSNSGVDNYNDIRVVAYCGSFFDCFCGAKSD